MASWLSCGHSSVTEKTKDVVYMRLWGQRMMAEVLQTTFSSAFSWMKIYYICSFKFEPKLKFEHKGAINNMLWLIQVIVWCWTGDKPLPEPIMSHFYSYIDYIIWPQWVNLDFPWSGSTLVLIKVWGIPLSLVLPYTCMISVIWKLMIEINLNMCENCIYFNSCVRLGFCILAHPTFTLTWLKSEQNQNAYIEHILHAFSQKTSSIFWFKFHRNLFLRALLTISCHWCSGNGLGWERRYKSGDLIQLSFKFSISFTVHSRYIAAIFQWLTHKGHSIARP